MSTLTIRDLQCERPVDRETMRGVRGGGAPWVFGWIAPYVPASARRGATPAINFYQINNTFQADQMINQFQSIDIRNSAANANIAVALDEQGKNLAQ